MYFVDINLKRNRNHNVLHCRRVVLDTFYFKVCQLFVCDTQCNVERYIYYKCLELFFRTCQFIFAIGLWILKKKMPFWTKFWNQMPSEEPVRFTRPAHACFGKLKWNFITICSVPVHVRPLATKPLLHSQEYEPGVFTHCAFTPQGLHKHSLSSGSE